MLLTKTRNIDLRASDNKPAKYKKKLLVPLYQFTQSHSRLLLLLLLLLLSLITFPTASLRHHHHHIQTQASRDKAAATH